MSRSSIEQLEVAILEELYEGYQLKVARIASRVGDRFPNFWSDDPDAADAIMDQALARVASRKDVHSFGDIRNWRFSEMCRAQFADDENTSALDKLLRNELEKLADADGGWRSLYRHRTTGRLWELSYPHSERHGGGPRAIRELILTNPEDWA